MKGTNSRVKINGRGRSPARRPSRSRYRRCALIGLVTTVDSASDAAAQHTRRVALHLPARLIVDRNDISGKGLPATMTHD